MYVVKNRKYLGCHASVDFLRAFLAARCFSSSLVFSAAAPSISPCSSSLTSGLSLLSVGQSSPFISRCISFRDIENSGEEIFSILPGIRDKAFNSMQVPVVKASWLEAEVCLETCSTVTRHLHASVLLYPQFAHDHVMDATVHVTPGVSFTPSVKTSVWDELTRGTRSAGCLRETLTPGGGGKPEPNHTDDFNSYSFLLKSNKIHYFQLYIAYITGQKCFQITWLRVTSSAYIFSSLKSQLTNEQQDIFTYFLAYFESSVDFTSGNIKGMKDARSAITTSVSPCLAEYRSDSSDSNPTSSALDAMVSLNYCTKFTYPKLRHR
ncbi:unnamed protein product [Leptidea sinapis]|uniref:Uncharacterized protein n=1 Tax=Leptidea sinapis TaxID=189913 RepID=A0A5E4R7E9_9NEOP|nr:unnamed protein product [Leptidea sinapis]